MDSHPSLLHISVFSITMSEQEVQDVILRIFEAQFRDKTFKKTCAWHRRRPWVLRKWNLEFIDSTTLTWKRMQLAKDSPSFFFIAERKITYPLEIIDCTIKKLCRKTRHNCVCYKRDQY